jgi:hypothetical protein
MKDLERMNSALFDKLKSNQFSKLSSIVGGAEKATCNDSSGACDVLHLNDVGEAESRYVSQSNLDEYLKDTVCNDKGNDKYATCTPTITGDGLYMTLTADDGEQCTYSLI